MKKTKGLTFFKLSKIPYTVSKNTKYEQLANYITGDIQSSIITAKEILDSIESIEKGLVDEDDRSGNAFIAFVTKDKVTIENGFTEESATYSLKDFKHAVSEWLDYLQTGKKRIVEFEE